MHSRTGHLTGALIGLAAALAVGYLLLKSAVQLDWIALTEQSLLPPGAPAHSSAPMVGMLLAIAIITGLLASTRRLSPLAPLLAGLVLLTVGMAYPFASQEQSWILRLPGNPGSDALLGTGIWQLLGGILLASAAMSWRWTGEPAPAERGRAAIGVLIGVLVGVLSVAGLWYLLQLANPVGYAYVFTTGVPYFSFRTGVPDLVLLPQAAAAIAIGALAAARWVSPVAAALSGIPLLTVGLLLVIAPAAAARWTAPLVFGAQQPIPLANGESLSIGMLVPVGALLLVSAAAPWRWRQLSTPPAAAAPAAMVEAA